MRVRLLYMIICGLLLSGCHYKDLEEESIQRNLLIRFLWDEAPDAAPESMLMYVFSGEAQPVVLPFADINGGPATLAPADYQFIAMNDGTEMPTRGARWETFEVYAPPTTLADFAQSSFAHRSPPRATGTEEQQYALEPEWLQTDGLEHVTLTASTETVTFTMHEAVKVYRFVIEDVQNAEHVTAVTATISGMSESWLAGYGRCTDTECMIPFLMQTGDDRSVSGSVRSFGHCPSGEIHRHLLTVYYELDNGRRLYAVIDVTDRLHDGHHDNGGDDPIVITGSAIPYNDDPADGGGIFDPEVDEWIEIHEDIYL